MKLIPYLRFKGNCEEALNYYKGLFGGDVPYLQRYDAAPEGMWDVNGSKDKILHAELSSGDMTIYMSDILDGEWKDGVGAVSLSINLKPDEDMDLIYEYLSKGGTVLVTIQDTFWNSRFATVVDRFGVQWIIDQEKA